LAKVFPGAEIAEFAEMVASLSEKDQATYNEIFQSLPLRLCPRGIGWIRRERLFWINWALQRQRGVQVIEEPRWTTVKLQAKRMPLTRWLPKGWALFVQEPLYPTAVRAITRTKPPYMPAGLDTCQPHEVERWRRHNYIYPPYQFRDEFMVRFRGGPWQPTNADMREVQMGFERGHTYTAWSTAERIRDPQGFERHRCSQMGNTYDAKGVAWVVSHKLAEWGILDRPATAEEVADPWSATSLQGLAVPSVYTEEWDSQEAAVTLSRFYLSRQSLRGGHVLALGEQAVCKATIPKSIDPREWIWRTAISTAWLREGEHINIYELRAYLLALRWRCKVLKNLGSRFLHLVDSKVTLLACVKGRSSSNNMRKVMTKISALTLAGDLLPVLGYVRSHLNPADAPSRAKQASAEVRNEPATECEVCRDRDRLQKVRCCRNGCVVHQNSCAVFSQNDARQWICVKCFHRDDEDDTAAVPEAAPRTWQRMCDRCRQEDNLDKVECVSCHRMVHDLLCAIHTSLLRGDDTLCVDCYDKRYPQCSVLPADFGNLSAATRRRRAS